jgi:hypothetical protein
MRDLTITADAAETLLESAQEKDVSENHPMYQEFQDAVENGTDIETEISERVIEDVVAGTLELEEFSLAELEEVDEISAFYKNRINRLQNKYACGEISLLELENKLKPLLTELMKNQEDI